MLLIYILLNSFNASLIILELNNYSSLVKLEDEYFMFLGFEVKRVHNLLEDNNIGGDVSSLRKRQFERCG